MTSKMDWFFKIIRIAGVYFPFAASVVQFQAEIDALIIDSRIKKLEDPISNLHEDVKPFSELIYRKIKSIDSIHLELENGEYIKFSRVIALLASAGYFETEHAAASSVPIGILLSDPTYIMYLCKLFEHTYKMEELIGLVDSCMIGEWLDGKGIAESIELPLCVVDAVFRIYEAKGLGLVSPDVGESSYLGQA